MRPTSVCPARTPILLSPPAQTRARYIVTWAWPTPPLRARHAVTSRPERGGRALADLTDAVAAKLAEVKGTAAGLDSIFHEAGANAHVRGAQLDAQQAGDCRMAAGAHLTARLRARVKEELGFTVSAGARAFDGSGGVLAEFKCMRGVSGCAGSLVQTCRHLAQQAPRQAGVVDEQARRPGGRSAPRGAGGNAGPAPEKDSQLRGQAGAAAAGHGLRHGGRRAGPQPAAAHRQVRRCQASGVRTPCCAWY